MYKKGTIDNTAVIILAAGNSTRMGCAKAFLKWNDTSTFLEHIIHSYFNFGCKKIIAILNKETVVSIRKENFNYLNNLDFIVNDFPERERFYSLKLGVGATHTCDSVFIHNVDNPFVNDEVLDKLITHSQHGDVIKPVFQGKSGHPILIRKSVISALHDYSGDEGNIKDFISNFKPFYCEVDSPEIHINIDDANEYKKYFCKKNK